MGRRRLIVTNGTAAVDRIDSLSIPADRIVAWSDVLHDGPVRSGLTTEQSRSERAGFLSSRGYGDRDEILNELSSRDETLERSVRAHDEIVLWFEHDLYDQLQLIQVLDRLATDDRVARDLYLVCRREFIGESTDAALLASFDGRIKVNSTHLSESRKAWSSFCDTDPQRLFELTMAEASGTLPFLAEACVRLLEELPHPQAGLSRTERQILESLRAGPVTPPVLFQTCQHREEAKFMGDLSFWTAMMPLWSSRRPLIETDLPPTGTIPWQQRGFLSQEFRITDVGREVLEGSANSVDHVKLDRWLGGTHLTNASYWTFGDGKLAEHRTG